MRCLSVRQPWASLIEAGTKTIELRSWTTHYRGPLLILAGSRPWRGKHDWPRDFPRGVTICVVDLVDVRPARADDADGARVTPAAGDFAWVLANPRPIARVPAKGKLGLYSPDATLLAAVGAP